MIGEIFCLLGSLLILIASLGYARLKEPLQRLHPTSIGLLGGLLLIWTGTMIQRWTLDEPVSFFPLIGILGAAILSPMMAHLLSRKLYKDTKS